MQGAKDPDEYIKSFGREAFARLLDQSENHIDYRIRQIRQKYDLTDDAQKVEFLRDAAGLVASLARPVEREVYGARCAQAAGISAEAMAQEVKRELSRRLKKEKKQQEGRDLSPALQLQPRERAMRYENIRSARAEEGVLRLVLLDPELLKRAERLGPEQFSAPLLARVFTLLRERWSAGLSVSLPALAGELEPGEMSHLTGVLNQPESLQNAEEAMGDYIEIIETEAAKRAGDGRADPLLVMREKYREKKGYGGCIHE